MTSQLGEGCLRWNDFSKCHDSFIIWIIYISNYIYLKRVLSWVSKYANTFDLIFIFFKKNSKIGGVEGKLKLKINYPFNPPHEMVT